MPAYMIFTREEPVFDEAEMDAYRSANREIAGSFQEKYGLKPLVVYGDLETFEGDAPDGVVMIEFPSMEDARAWYNSPEYQSALKHRLKSARYRAVLVDGL